MKELQKLSLELNFEKSTFTLSVKVKLRGSF